MARDWLKIRMDLHDDPAVIRMVEVLELSEDAVVGKLVRFWGWWSEQTVSGSCPHSVRILSALDRRVDCNNFAKAMSEVGWLAVENGELRIPRWERHLSQSAKRRALEAERKRSERCGNVRNLSALQADKNRTREEERRSRTPRAPLTRKRDEKKTAAAKRDPALELFERLSLPRSQRAEALEAIAQHGYTAEDLAAWDDCYRQARKQSLRDPPSFVRARMLRHRHPRTAGISWYVETAPVDEDRKRLVAAVRKHAGKTVVDTQRREWRLDDGGLGFHGPRGFRLVSTLPLDDLRAIAGGKVKDA